MIDGITLSLRTKKDWKFPKKFDNYVDERIYQNFNYLANHYPESSVKHYKLDLSYNIQTRTLKISKSLRKWYFGAVSTKDFDIVELKKAFCLLEEGLELPKGALFEAKVQKMEFGKNLRLPNTIGINFQKLFPPKNKKGWSIYPNSASFNSENYNIKLYDKYSDILEKIKYRKNVVDKERVRKRIHLLTKKYFLLRYEVLINRPLRIGGVNTEKTTNKNSFTVNDIFLQYDNLLRFWFDKIKGMIWSKGISKSIVKSREMLETFLLNIGIDSVGFMIVFDIISNLEDLKDSQKSKYKKKLIENYKDMFEDKNIKKKVIVTVIQTVIDQRRVLRTLG